MNLASSLTTWIFVAVVLFAYVLFYADDESGRQYVPKSERSYVINMTHRLGGMFQAWIIRVWNVLEEHVYEFKTNRRRHIIHYDPNRKRRTRFKALPTIPCIIAMQGTGDTEGKRNYTTPFDTDSVLLRVDNCASACMSPHKSDFITPLIPIRKRVKGIGGTVRTGIATATMKVTIEDDNGVPHDIMVPDSYYVPDCPSRLLSPQHWAQKAKDNHPK